MVKSKTCTSPLREFALEGTLLEEVGLALEGDHLHPIKGVAAVEDLAVSKG